MKKKLVYGFLLMIAIVLQGCGAKYDCEELQYDSNKKRFVTIESEKLANGKCISSYDNGNLQVKMEFKNGRRYGTWETYYENGQLERIWRYKDGNRHGEQLSYYENGQLRAKLNRIDGKIIEYTKYYNNGEKMFEHVYPEKGEENLPKSLKAWYENDYEETKTAKSLKAWYEDGSVKYDFVAKENEPMILHINVDRNLPEDIVKYSRYIKNGQGKVFNTNGDWLTKAFFEGERPLLAQELSAWEVDSGTSIQTVTKIDVFGKPKKHIEYVYFYKPVYKPAIGNSVEHTSISIYESTATTIDEFLSEFNQSQLRYQQRANN